MSETPRDFRLLGEPTDVSVIARGRGIGIRRFLQQKYGGHACRKVKGNARVEADDGWIGNAGLHWFEAHGVGKVQWKIKRRLK